MFLCSLLKWVGIMNILLLPKSCGSKTFFQSFLRESIVILAGLRFRQERLKKEECLLLLVLSFFLRFCFSNSSINSQSKYRSKCCPIISTHSHDRRIICLICFPSCNYYHWTQIVLYFSEYLQTTLPFRRDFVVWIGVWNPSKRALLHRLML